MNKFFRTILALSIIITNLDVRVLHAQMVTAYTPVMPVTLTAPVITNLPLVTPSVSEKEKILDLSALSFSFPKTDFGSLSRPLNKSNGLSSVNCVYGPAGRSMAFQVRPLMDL